MNPRRSQWIDTKLSENPQALEPYKKIKGEKLPVTGYDPVQCYLKELEVRILSLDVSTIVGHCA